MSPYFLTSILRHNSAINTVWVHSSTAQRADLIANYLSHLARYPITQFFNYKPINGKPYVVYLPSNLDEWPGPDDPRWSKSILVTDFKNDPTYQQYTNRAPCITHLSNLTKEEWQHMWVTYFNEMNSPDCLTDIDTDYAVTQGWMVSHGYIVPLLNADINHIQTYAQALQYVLDNKTKHPVFEKALKIYKSRTLPITNDLVARAVTPTTFNQLQDQVRANPYNYYHHHFDELGLPMYTPIRPFN